MKSVIFNGLACHYHTSGFGVYSRNILLELKKLGLIKSGFFLEKDSFSKNIKFLKVSKILKFNNGLFSHLLRILWYQIVLPFRITDKNTIFYSPLPEGSIWGRFDQIVTIHDIIPLRFEEYHKNLKWYYKIFIPLIIKKSKYIVTPSEFTKKDIIDYFKTPEYKIIVAPNGFDHTTFYKEDNIEKENFMVFIGDLRPHKNFDNTIKAFAKTKGIKLKIIGKQDGRFYFKALELINQLGLIDRVEFTGYLTDDELRIILNSSKGLLFPSLYEGFGLPIVEALACNCPVLTSRGSSMQEVANEHTLFVDPYNIEDIYNKIEILRNNQNKQMNQDIDFSHLYDWSKTAKTVCNTIEKIHI
ncbi:MAG: glycosyltransferase family 4 protein [Halobacteriovoraceae bacterium]|nr:glycosyltransferase family 4 protein [Halobacteriovoraceae bacterium]